MGTYRVIEPKGNPSPSVDEWTLHQRIREGTLQPQTMIEWDGKVLPAAQIPALEPMFQRATRPLAAYLQPSQAGYVPPEIAEPSARLTSAQIIGILVGVGCLVLWFVSMSTSSARGDSQGQWNHVAIAGGQQTTRSETNSTR